MEKHHFHDRSEQCKQRNQVPVGSVMYICTKEAQKYAKNLNHLTKVICVAHLSRKEFHQRGLKIRGFIIRDNINPTPGQINKVVEYYNANRKLIDSGENKLLSDKFVVGRGVYLLDKDGNRL